MNLQEYQAKSLLAGAGVAVPRGRIATSPDDADAAARELDGPVVVKAQILAGARGKAGGVKLAATPEEASAAARTRIASLFPKEKRSMELTRLIEGLVR